MPKKKLAALKPNAKNPRTITDAKAKMLKDSLARFGDLSGIVYNRTSGQVVGGHQRITAFKSLGADDVEIERSYDVASHTGTVAEGAVTISGERYAYREVEWDADTEKAANLAANKGAGEWDMGQVAEWVAELADVDFDLDLTMFGEDERNALVPKTVHVADEIAPEDDEIPPPQEDCGVVTGDLFKLGSHRLICGDSAQFGVVEKLMQGSRAHVVFTDPPYNQASHTKGFAREVSASMNTLMESDWDKNFDFRDVENNLLSVLHEDATVYVCTSHFLAPQIWQWMSEWASHHLYCVWAKPNPMPSLAKRHWTWSTELICYATRGKHTFNFPEQGHALSAWNLTKSSKCDLHPTMKPISVPMHAIEASSNFGDNVVDLFGGAGSTLIACEKTGRNCYLAEIAPRYVRVIIDRWQKLTGKTAELIGSGTAEDIDAK